MSSRLIHYSYSRVAPISGTQLNSRELLSPNPSNTADHLLSLCEIGRLHVVLTHVQYQQNMAERSYFTHEPWQQTHRNYFACFRGQRAPQRPRFCFILQKLPLLMNSWVVWVHGLVGTHTHEFRLMSVLILLSSGVSEQLNSTHSNHDEPWLRVLNSSLVNKHFLVWLSASLTI